MGRCRQSDGKSVKVGAKTWDAECSEACWYFRSIMVLSCHCLLDLGLFTLVVRAAFPRGAVRLSSDSRVYTARWSHVPVVRGIAVSLRPCASAPVFPCARVPVRPCARVPVRPCARVLIRRSVTVPVRPCSRALVFPYAGALLFPCARVLIRSGAFVFPCARVLIRRSVLFPCARVPVRSCSHTPERHCSRAPVFPCAHVPVRLCSRNPVWLCPLALVFTRVGILLFLGT